MRSMVILESMFGNTRLVAEAIADGIGTSILVDLVRVDEAPPEIQSDVVLLVVGGPTHAFGMSRPRTREDAMTQKGDGPRSAGNGMREWLASITGGKRPVAAAFDTRIDKPRVPGSAARAAEKRLRKLGFPLATRAESFYVSGTSGPLVEGELERARRWGETLGEAVLNDLGRTTGTASPKRRREGDHHGDRYHETS